MSMNKQTAIAGLILLGLFAIPAGAGNLEPNMPPGPTMKTLQEVEPRTPVSSLPFTIDTPGSYYLTANLIGSSGLDGITIASDDVTLDLNGFTLTGVAGSLDGIKVIPRSPTPFPRQNLKVHNGAVRNWGGGGVTGESSMLNAQFSDLRLFNNGGHGIAAGPACQVRRCFVKSNGGSGIRHVNQSAVIEDNEVRGNSIGLDLVGTEAVVRNNIVRGNSDNYNILFNNRVDLLLCEIPETIDFACKATLIANLIGSSGQDGITIDTDDVTLDLNGFSLTGVPGSLSGITISGSLIPSIVRSNIVVRNGAIRNWGALGISRTLNSGTKCQFLDLQVYNNVTDGILTGATCAVKRCVVRDNGGSGINAGGNDCIIEDNTVTGNATGLFTLQTNCVFRNNVVSGNTAAGLHVSGDSCCIEGNRFVNNETGLDINASGNAVANNIVKGNTDN